MLKIMLNISTDRYVIFHLLLSELYQFIIRTYDFITDNLTHSLNLLNYYQFYYKKIYKLIY